MGLKTTSYISKSLGVTLPTAYAVLSTLIVEKDNRVRAIFSIQNTRENTQVLAPIDKVEVNFVWDRKTDLAKMAYETARNEVKTIEYLDEASGHIITKQELGTLYGWKSDIL